jgi:hypothetical protein
VIQGDHVPTHFLDCVAEGEVACAEHPADVAPQPAQRCVVCWRDTMSSM